MNVLMYKPGSVVVYNDKYLFMVVTSEKMIQKFAWLRGLKLKDFDIVYGYDSVACKFYNLLHHLDPDPKNPSTKRII